MTKEQQQYNNLAAQIEAGKSLRMVMNAAVAQQQQQQVQQQYAAAQQ